MLLLDTFEAAVGLEDWLREQFVPALPACALVVVAGRNGPGEAWRRDPGWGDLLRVVSLRNLGPDDARAFLRGAGVAEEQQGWMLELSHGHPLALSLLVDVLSQRQATRRGVGRWSWAPRPTWWGGWWRASWPGCRARAIGWRSTAWPTRG